VGGVALANVYIGTVSNKHLSKAINRYNELSKAQMGIKLSSSGQTGVSVGITYPL
jgi:hypothetical protein